jgi:hypothetical protein
LPKKCDPIAWFDVELLPSRVDQSGRYFAWRLFSESPQKEETFCHSVLSRKERTRPNDKVLIEIRWILREIPSPCISPATIDPKISTSRVLCKRAVDPWSKGYLLVDIGTVMAPPIECEWEASEAAGG